MAEPSETIIPALAGYYIVLVPDDEDERDKIANNILSPLRLPIIAWRIGRELCSDGTLTTMVYPIHSDGEMGIHEEYGIETPIGIEHPFGFYDNIASFMKKFGK